MMMETMSDTQATANEKWYAELPSKPSVMAHSRILMAAVGANRAPTLMAM